MQRHHAVTAKQTRNCETGRTREKPLAKKETDQNKEKLTELLTNKRLTRFWKKKKPTLPLPMKSVEAGTSQSVRISPVSLQLLPTLKGDRAARAGGGCDWCQ